MQSEDREKLLQLLRGQRWAALATIDDDGPSASMVSFAATPDLTGLLIFTSGLSQHTRSLLADPRCSIVVAEPDSGEGDPQALARLSLQTTAHVVARDSVEFESLAGIYLARLPHAAQLFGLGDFVLFRLAIERARLVAGFARAHRVSTAELRQLSADRA